VNNAAAHWVPLNRILGRLHQIGCASVVPCLFRRLRYWLLSRRYGFPRWHVGAPFACRPYKAEVVRLANELRPRVTVEVGCGLGEILSRVSGEERLGFDPDASVVAAARHLYGRKCEFSVASVSETHRISSAIGRAVDVLIMVNWPHGIAWNELRGHVLRLTEVLSIGHIIVDTIDPGIDGYPYHHSPAEIATLGKSVSTHRSRDGVRHIHVVTVT